VCIITSKYNYYKHKTARSTYIHAFAVMSYTVWIKSREVRLWCVSCVHLNYTRKLRNSTRLHSHDRIEEMQQTSEYTYNNALYCYTHTHTHIHTHAYIYTHTRITTEHTFVNNNNLDLNLQVSIIYITYVHTHTFYNYDTHQWFVLLSSSFKLSLTMAQRGRNM
jgi:hypothetical protein